MSRLVFLCPLSLVLTIWAAIAPLSMAAAAIGGALVAIGFGLAPKILRRTWRSPLRAREITAIGAIGYGAIVLLAAAAAVLQPALAPDIVTADVAGVNGTGFAIVSNESELDAIIARAKGQRQPMMLKLWANWCGECKAMEASVFSAASVQR